MTDVTVELLNRRTAVAAVRQEAARAGLDAERLLDSKQLNDQLAGLDPDAPGFTGRIQELVGEAAGRLGGARPAASPQGQEQASRQWTLDDVNRLPKNHEGGRRLQEAIDAGLLVDLGHPPYRHRGY